MRSVRLPFLLAAGALAAAAALPHSAFALDHDGGGNRDLRDAYTDQLVGHPQWIEPGGQNDPARYRVGDPSAGYYARQAARGGYYDGDAYGRYAPRRGRVTVAPYGPDSDD